MIENKLTLFDIVMFIKRKKWIIIISTLLVTVFTVFYGSFLNNGSTSSEEEIEEVETTDVEQEEVFELLLIEEDNRSASEQSKIEDYLLRDRFFFRVYIENPDYSVFSNSDLFKEMLLSEEFMSLVEDRTEILYEEFLEDFIHVYFHPDNNIFTVAFRSGEFDYNQELSGVFYEILETEELELLENRHLYFFDEPQEFIPTVTDEDITEENEGRQAILTNPLISIPVGIVFGVIIGALLAVFHSLIGKNVDIFFNYNLSEEDSFINLSRIKSDKIEESIKHIVNYNSKEVVILSSSEIKLFESSEIDKFEDFSDIPLDSQYEKIVILVKIGETKKTWFRNQKILTKAQSLPINVIGM